MEHRAGLGALSQAMFPWYNQLLSRELALPEATFVLLSVAFYLGCYFCWGGRSTFARDSHSRSSRRVHAILNQVKHRTSQYPCIEQWVCNTFQVSTMEEYHNQKTNSHKLLKNFPLILSSLVLHLITSMLFALPKLVYILAINVDPDLIPPVCRSSTLVALLNLLLKFLFLKPCAQYLAQLKKTRQATIARQQISVHKRVTETLYLLRLLSDVMWH